MSTPRPSARPDAHTLEKALRELRRFANRMVDTPYGREALRYQDLADKALGYCGCPNCSAARDAEARP